MNDVAKIHPESGQVNCRLVFAVVAGWFLFVFISLTVLAFVNSAYPYPAPPAPETYPSPRLISHPNLNLPPYIDAQRKLLAGNAGRSAVALLPITRAMAVVAGRPDPYAPLGPQGTSPP